MNVATAIEAEVNVSRALRVRATKSREWNKNRKLGVQSPSAIAKGAAGSGVIRRHNYDGVVDDYCVVQGAKVDEWVYTATHLRRFLEEMPGNGVGWCDGSVLCLFGSGSGGGGGGDSSSGGVFLACFGDSGGRCSGGRCSGRPPLPSASTSLLP